MKPAETILHSANVLVCTLGVVTASGAMVGAAPFVGGAMSITALMCSARPKTSALDKRVGAMLTTSLNNPKVHLPQEAAKIIPQMIEVGALSHGEVMRAARDPAKICAAMLAKLKGPEHRRADMQQAFERVVVPIFAELLNDRDVCDTLRPAYERALAGAIAHIQQEVRDEGERSQERHAEVMAALMQLAKQTGSQALAYQGGVSEEQFIALAQRIADDVDDTETAFVELTRVVSLSIDSQTSEPSHSSNLPDAINDVIGRVDELNDAGQIDEGKAALLAAMADQRDLAAQAQAGQVRLIAKGLTQAVLTRDVDMAVTLELERLALDAAGFDALRAAQGEWYERGHDKGVRFDLEVAIALAEICTERAGDADQRGAAATDLGTALHTLGERESGTVRLKAAVTVYTRALEEYTQDRVPWGWAGTQNNLGNALWNLGKRESGTARLEEAVTAYTRALEEWTQDRVPLDWAMTQNNLGNALQTLGTRESGTARLEEAVAAFRRALEERTQDRVPLDWAGTQYNLAFVEVAFAQKTDGPEQERHARAALAHVEAALQVFDPESSRFYFDKASTLRKDLLDALQQS